MPRLQKLDMSYNKIDNIILKNQEDHLTKGVLGLVGLEDLNLSHNNLLDLNGLQLGRFKFLRRIKLCDNKLVKLNYLGNLDGLQELDVARNRIK